MHRKRQSRQNHPPAAARATLVRRGCGERRFNLKEFTLSIATAHCLKPVGPHKRAMHVSLVELSGGTMPQWRRWDRILILVPQNSKVRPALANKLPPHTSPGRERWLVTNSLPFWVVGDAKAPDPAVLCSLIFPVTNIGPEKGWSILERLSRELQLPLGRLLQSQRSACNPTCHSAS